MSSVTVTVTGRRLSDVEFSSEDLMREVGLLVRERILRRTASGRDANELPFAPYSAAYALRKAKEVGPGSVNLMLSNGMLGAITITEVTKNRVTLGFSS